MCCGRWPHVRFSKDAMSVERNMVEMLVPLFSWRRAAAVPCHCCTPLRTHHAPAA